MDLGIVLRKHALHNAAKFSGKASAGAVIGKVLQEEPSLKERIAEVKAIAARIVDEVNKMAPQDQLSELERVAPELLEKKEAKEKDLFAFLGIKEGDNVTTAFPPEPSKYPHIGHAKAIILNHELASRYNGRFVLRFDDTNPALARKEFYDIHLDNYRWLGLSWNELDYGSDHMDIYYRHCVQLLEQGHAYVCTCSQDDIKKSRMQSVACRCRIRSREENMQLWKDLPNLPEGSGIVRLKIDLEHKNSAMRDPTIFRIIDEPHPRVKKHRVWPTYDFETAIMDCIGKITHRLRSKEFELRNELQRYIQSLLGYPETFIYEFARFNLEGVPSSGRIIREMMQKKELIGWDDPSLTTIVALRRRGFLPEAIKSFVLSTGITKSEATLTWDDLFVHNRRLLDKLCDRYFFVHEPVEVLIENAPEQELFLKKHPEIAEKG
ncbi:MAG: glutamate--tRNA ligase, partial [Candidatus Woesearchaeota archaeon]